MSSGTMAKRRSKRTRRESGRGRRELEGTGTGGGGVARLTAVGGCRTGGRSEPLGSGTGPSGFIFTNQPSSVPSVNLGETQTDRQVGSPTYLNTRWATQVSRFQQMMSTAVTSECAVLEHHQPLVL